MKARFFIQIFRIIATALLVYFILQFIFGYHYLYVFYHLDFRQVFYQFGIEDLPFSKVSGLGYFLEFLAYVVFQAVAIILMILNNFHKKIWFRFLMLCGAYFLAILVVAILLFLEAEMYESVMDWIFTAGLILSSIFTGIIWLKPSNIKLTTTL